MPGIGRGLFICFAVVCYLGSTGVCSQSCDIISHFLESSVTIRPTADTNGICSRTNQRNCCSSTVEDKLLQSAEEKLNILLFPNFKNLTHSTQKLYRDMQNIELRFLNPELKIAVQQYSILSDRKNGHSSTANLILDDIIIYYLQTYVDMTSTPKHCLNKIIPRMRPRILEYLQELMYAKSQITESWKVGEKLLNAIYDTHFSHGCLVAMLQSGLPRHSCKSCKDETARFPTCTSLCSDVVRHCIQPFTSFIPLISTWMVLEHKIRRNILTYLTEERFNKLQHNFNSIITDIMKDTFDADVCGYHFQETSSDIYDASYESIEKANRPTLGPRRRRLIKTPPPEPPSSRSLTTSTLYTETEDSSDHSNSHVAFINYPQVAGSLAEFWFNPHQICYDITKSMRDRHCWNGTDIGNYTPGKFVIQDDNAIDFSSITRIIKSDIDRLSETANRPLRNASDVEDNNTHSLSGMQVNKLSNIFLVFIIIPLKILVY